MKAFSPQSRRRRGFTLIEVMIVIAIILALASLVGVALFQRRAEAKTDLARIDMRTIQNGLKQFRLVYDRYPTEEEGLAVLWSKDSLSPDADQAKWSKFLETPMPSDRWGREWGYRAQSEHGDETEFDLWSNGPDGEEGTEDDLTSWSNAAGDPEAGAGEAPPPAPGG